MRNTILKTATAVSLPGASGAMAHGGDHSAVPWHHALSSADHLLLAALGVAAVAGAISLARKHLTPARLRVKADRSRSRR